MRFRAPRRWQLGHGAVLLHLGGRCSAFVAASKAHPDDEDDQSEEDDTADDTASNGPSFRMIYRRGRGAR